MDETYPHFFNYDAYITQYPYHRPECTEFQKGQEIEFVASVKLHRSRVFDHKLRSIRHDYKVPVDVHFYKPTKDERANQPPSGMIAVNKVVLEAGLRSPAPSDLTFVGSVEPKHNPDYAKWVELHLGDDRALGKCRPVQTTHPR